MAALQQVVDLSQPLNDPVSFDLDVTDCTNLPVILKCASKIQSVAAVTGFVNLAFQMWFKFVTANSNMFKGLDLFFAPSIEKYSMP